ncbi:ABC transporter ATP-binding protein [Aquiflexum sp.]|uniref:ABC transporter ATP-binding protein n=1 Tax=Aquiflexum sp. TaxID=1872584 RepID=UPI0035931126
MENHLKDKEFTRKRALWPFILRIFNYSFRHKKWCSVLIGGAIVDACIVGVLPIIWYKYIDNFITPVVLSMRESGISGFTDAMAQTMTQYGILYLGAILLQSAGMVVFIYAAGRLKEFVVFDLRKEMFNKLQHLPYSFYDRSAIGWLSIRLTSDVDKVSDIISFGFVSLVGGVMMILVSLIAMFIYHWQLACMVCLSIPLMMFASVKIRMLILGYSRNARRIYSQMAAFLTENINAIEVNKATVHEDQSSVEFNSITQELKHSSYKAAWYTAMYRPVVVLLGSLVAAAVIYFGGHLVLNPASGFTLGLLAAFFGYARMIFDPIMEVTQFYAAAQDSLSAGERIFSLIDEPVGIKDHPNAKTAPVLAGNICFENVDFSYIPNRPVIEKLNISIKAGESIALVGPTGEGKSTIINLISRFYEPTQGRITMDGIDYTSLTLQSFRSQLGVILQTPYLFSGTIRENLCYGRLDASDRDMVEVLESLGIAEFADRLDDEVGEEGNNLSSGEKQLISFARVVLRNPRILLMDEATSSIDTLIENKIQNGIATLLKSRTSIVIAHRLSTIRNCDRILVIQQGKIIEQGNHESLLNKSGVYRKLYTSQFEALSV